MNAAPAPESAISASHARLPDMQQTKTVKTDTTASSIFTTRISISLAFSALGVFAAARAGGRLIIKKVGQKHEH